MQSRILISIVTFLALFFQQCSSSLPIEKESVIHGYCEVTYPFYPKENVNITTPRSLKANALIISYFSQESIHIAMISGLSNILFEYASAKIEFEENPTEINFNKYQTILQSLLNQLEVIERQVASIIGELDCESERAEIAIDFLDYHNTQNINRLTVFAIIVGGIVGTVTSVIPISPTEKFIAITGGLTSIFLSYSVFLVDDTLLFEHPKNILRSIWKNEPDYNLWPPAVWNYLNDDLFAHGKNGGIRMDLMYNYSNHLTLPSERYDLFL